MQRLPVLLTIFCLSSVVTITSLIELPVQSQSLNNSQTEQLLKQAAFFVQSNQLLAAQTKLEQALRVALELKDPQKSKRRSHKFRHSLLSSGLLHPDNRFFAAIAINFRRLWPKW